MPNSIPSLELQQKQAMTLRQMQRLMMSPQMQQALGLLQLPLVELSQKVEQELEQNPIIELSEDEDEKEFETADEEASEGEALHPEEELVFDEKNFEILKRIDDDWDGPDYLPHSYNQTSEEARLHSHRESMIQAQVTLFEHLMKQAKETFQDAKSVMLAELLIGNFDERGFLETPIEELSLLGGCKAEQLEKILLEIQTFEPSGIGARNLRESLLIQLHHQCKGNSLAYRLVRDHYDHLLHNRIPAIQKELALSSEQITQTIRNDIACLDLRPGMAFSSMGIQTIIPDVILQEENEKLVVIVQDDYIPSFRLNSRYLHLLKDQSLGQETKKFIQPEIGFAKWPKW